MPWDQLYLYVYNLSCQVIPVRVDGFCFLHAIDIVLHMNHNEVVTFNSMESTILDHLAANVNYYKLLHTGDALRKAKMYFKFRTYCDNVFDVTVVATERALKLNLTIYQKGPKGILQHTTHAAGKEVHLKFKCDPSNVVNNSYESISLLNKPIEMHTGEELTIESPCPNTLEQLMSLNDVIDLKDDSKMTTVQQPDTSNTSNNEL